MIKGASITVNPDEEHPPINKTNLGAIQPRMTNNVDQSQQGFMSIQGVAGETTTSGAVAQTTNPGAADPNYLIPKISGRNSLQSNKLNQIALNVSPPAKERPKESDETRAHQPHKQKKGRQLGQQGGTRKRSGGSCKK